MNDAEFARLYGEWTERTPADVAALLASYRGTWWIAGGWALEAPSGVEWPHEDIDPAVLRGELPILRRHLAGRLHASAPFSGALKPLDPVDRPDAAAEEVPPKGRAQLWTRRDAQHA